MYEEYGENKGYSLKIVRFVYLSYFMQKFRSLILQALGGKVGG